VYLHGTLTYIIILIFLNAKKFHNNDIFIYKVEVDKKSHKNKDELEINI